MLADTPWPHGFGAALASVDTFSKGSRTVRYLPALPCRLRAMGRAVRSSSSSPDNHFQQLSRSHEGLPTTRPEPHGALSEYSPCRNRAVYVHNARCNLFRVFIGNANRNPVEVAGQRQRCLPILFCNSEVCFIHWWVKSHFIRGVCGIRLAVHFFCPLA